MTIDQFIGSLQAYSEILLKKEETKSHVLKTNDSVKDKDKLLYSLDTRRRGRGCANKNFNRGRGRVHVSNRFKRREQTNQRNWRQQGSSRGRGARMTPGRGCR